MEGNSHKILDLSFWKCEIPWSYQTMAARQQEDFKNIGAITWRKSTMENEINMLSNFDHLKDLEFLMKSLRVI